MSATQPINASTKRRLLFVLTGVALALLLVIAASFLLAQRARSEAARYLRVVPLLRIGTTYDVVAAELRDAGIPTKLLGDRRGCRDECSLIFYVDDKWLYLLHLAPPIGVVGQLRFLDGKLADKTTAMGYGVCCDAIVRETVATISRPFMGNLDASGHPFRIRVEIAPNDFTDYRKQAYAFDVTCIGSMKGCRTDEYLPTAKYLQQASTK